MISAYLLRSLFGTGVVPYRTEAQAIGGFFPGMSTDTMDTRQFHLSLRRKKVLEGSKK